MTTARQIITKSMQKIGLLTKTEQPSADEINDGLYSLNAMLSTWSNEANLINVRVSESFNLVAGTSSYTIGTGQTFNTTRPTFINDGYVRLAGIDYPIMTITDEAYAEITDKSITGIPYWVNFTNGFPVATLNFYPKPSQAYVYTMLSEKPISSLTLDSVISLPPGWEEAIIYNLAVRIASEYGQPSDALTVSIAASTLRSIMTAIMRNRTLDCPPRSGKLLFDSGYYV